MSDIILNLLSPRVEPLPVEHNVLSVGYAVCPGRFVPGYNHGALLVGGLLCNGGWGRAVGAGHLDRVGGLTVTHGVVSQSDHSHLYCTTCKNSQQVEFHLANKISLRELIYMFLRKLS